MNVILGGVISFICFINSASASEAHTKTPQIETAETARSYTIQIAGQNITYRSMWQETALKNKEGVIQATISSTSYIRQQVDHPFERPVMFLFNGGPGASSSPLHFSAFGPRIRSSVKGETRFVDNIVSLIDVVDLVFIDPVGTGFSREKISGGGDAYWSVEGDAEAVLQLVHNWLKKNNRQQSPLFFAGESYGGFRLGTMVKNMKDLNVKGLVILSPMLDASGSATVRGNDNPYIFTLPTMAVAAWEHGRINKKGRSVQQIWEEARSFSQSEYVISLQQGNALSVGDKSQVAHKMSKLIGLSADLIMEKNLRIKTQFFLENLLKDQDKLVGRLDTRVTIKNRVEPLNPDRPAAANDPSLGLGRSNVIKSAGIAHYLKEEVGVQTDLDYYSLTLDVNFKWNWRGVGKSPNFYINVAPNIADLMEENPDIQLLHLGGYYDLATPLLAARYALNHAGVPVDRVSSYAFVSGHSPFKGDQNRKCVSAVVKAFLAHKINFTKQDCMSSTPLFIE